MSVENPVASLGKSKLVSSPSAFYVLVGGADFLALSLRHGLTNTHLLFLKTQSSRHLESLSFVVVGLRGLLEDSLPK